MNALAMEMLLARLSALRSVLSGETPDAEMTEFLKEFDKGDLPSTEGGKRRQTALAMVDLIGTDVFARLTDKRKGEVFGFAAGRANLSQEERQAA